MTRGQRFVLRFGLLTAMLAGVAIGGFGGRQAALIQHGLLDWPLWRVWLIALAAFVPVWVILQWLIAKGIRQAGWDDLGLDEPQWTIR